MNRVNGFENNNHNNNNQSELKKPNFFKLLLYIKILHSSWYHFLESSPTGREVVREAGCLIKGPGFESRVKHGCRAVRPWPHKWLRSKTGRRKVTGSFLGRAYIANQT